MEKLGCFAPRQRTVDNRGPSVFDCAFDMISGRGDLVAECTIENGRTPIINRALGRSETALFFHAAYLQQSDIRKLVTADSIGLGDVIRTLAVDDAIYRLERALSDANISRSSRNYLAAKRKLDASLSETHELRARVDDMK